MSDDKFNFNLEEMEKALNSPKHRVSDIKSDEDFENWLNSENKTSKEDCK